MRKIVLMISPNNFPNGDAGAVRDLSFAKIYTELGYTPIVLCCNREVSYGNYEGIEYISYYLEAKSNIDKIFRYRKQKTLFLEKLNILEKKYGIPSLIHLYGITNNLFQIIKEYGEQNSIQIIHDSVEWYSPCEFKYRYFDKAYILNNRLNTSLVQSPIKVIAISDYLKAYFESKGIRCVRIPVILDIENSIGNSIGNSNHTGIVKLIYAGSPAQKDYLKEIVEGVLSLDDDEKKLLQLNIYGVSQKQLELLGIKNIIHDCIIAHGRVSRKEVENALSRSDFSLLLRPQDERYAKAGFPTKSVEAMANGAAMMCNISSDLGLYLTDGENSIVVESCTSEAMAKAIRRVIKMDRRQIDAIKSNAMKTAIERFDYRMYISTVAELIMS